MFHIGIATQHPPLPEKGQLSELGIDFVEKCLDIDPMKRPTAAELMEHEWIVQFSQEIAREMNNHESRLGQYAEEEEYQQHEGDELPADMLQDIPEEVAEEAAYAEGEEQVYQEDDGRVYQEDHEQAYQEDHEQVHQGEHEQA